MLQATTPVAVQPVGMTSTAWVAIGQTVLQAIFGGGLLYTVARGVALLWRTYNESKKQDNDAAAAVRKEMMDISDRQAKRIDELERAGREERNRFDSEIRAERLKHADEVTQIRTSYETEIRALRDEIAGLRRQMVQWQQSSGTAATLSQRAPTNAMKRAEDAGFGDVFRRLGDVPDVETDANKG